MQGRIHLDKTIEYSKKDYKKIYKVIREIDLYRSDFFRTLVSKLTGRIGNIFSENLDIEYAKEIKTKKIPNDIQNIFNEINLDGMFTISVKNPGNYKPKEPNDLIEQLVAYEPNNDDPTQTIFLYRPTTSKTYAIILKKK